MLVYSWINKIDHSESNENINVINRRNFKELLARNHVAIWNHFQKIKLVTCNLKFWRKNCLDHSLYKIKLKKKRPLIFSLYTERYGFPNALKKAHKTIVIHFYFLLPTSRESIGSNFRNGDFVGFTRFEVSWIRKLYF